MNLNSEGLTTATEFPWHQSQWQRLTSQLQQLPHALLIQGQQGLGKNAFALRLARTLLCSQINEAGEICGRCRNCQLLSAGSHPDLNLLRPAEEGKPITVDQIRAFKEYIYLHPHTAVRKVTIISPAETMNINACNSLLKLLEEPPLGNIIILVSHQPHHLAITVRSRCHRIDFTVPDRVSALTWIHNAGNNVDNPDLLLDLAHGAPLRALQLVTDDFLKHRQQLLTDVNNLATGVADPIECAQRWHKLDIGYCLSWLHGLVSDLIKIAYHPAPPVKLINADVRAKLENLHNGLTLTQLFAFYDTILKIRGLLSTPVDQLLLIEDILIRWTRMKRQ